MRNRTEHRGDLNIAIRTSRAGEAKRYAGLKRFDPRWLLLAAFLTAASIAQAVQTNQVEIGEGSNYDGTVLIDRDPSGRMTFVDSENTTPRILSDLISGVTTHSGLGGLAADDHTQYLNTSRHGSEHDATFNGELSIPADVDSNATLGAHTGDADIHLNRTGAETISGTWTFAGRPDIGDGLFFRKGPDPDDERIFFEDDPGLATFWFDTDTHSFNFERTLQVWESLGVGVDPLTRLHLAEAVPSTIIRQENNSVFATSNSAEFEQLLRSSTQAREAFAIRTNFSITADSTRTSRVEFLTADSGTFAPALVIEGSHVGIGTSSPARTLDVLGTGAMFRLNDSSATGNPMMTFDQAGGRRSYIQHVDGGDVLRLVSEFGDIDLYTGIGGTEVLRVRLTESGDMGVGVFSPTRRLEVFDDVADYVAGFTNDGNLAAHEGIMVQAGLDDGTGVTGYYDAFDGDGGAVGSIENNAGTFQLVDLSDRRRKKNITPTVINGMEVIRAIPVRDFHWDFQSDGEKKRRAGFIAQEVEAAFPEAVSFMPVSSTQSVRFKGVARSALIPVLVKAVQELEQETIRLDAIVIAMEVRLAALEGR